MAGTLLSVGHGYSARALARVLLAEGWRVIGTTRSRRGAADLASTGVEGVEWPGTSLTEFLREASHLLVSVPPAADGDPVLKRAGRNILARGARISWVGYLSTTGVYGDHAGAWVDESTPPSPATERGRRRLAVEAAWRDTGLPLHIFRLAGIYGPGRGPLQKVLDGTARRIVKPGQVFSRIHVDDIAAVLHASMKRPRPGAVYNVCDDDPAPPEEVIAFAASLLGAPVPETEDFARADLSPMARSFYAESKRVRNDLVRTELGVRLKYPDFRSGLRSLLEGKPCLPESQHGQIRGNSLGT